RSAPLVLPALMMREQASIAVSAVAFSSLQTLQSSARAGEARAPVRAIKAARAARRMANLCGGIGRHGRSGHYPRQRVGCPALTSLTNFEGIRLPLDLVSARAAWRQNDEGRQAR